MAVYHCFAGCGKPCGSLIDAALLFFNLLNPLNYHIMKKLLFLFTATVLLGCSGDSDSSTSPDSHNPLGSLHPPVWIQGTWNQTITDGSTVPMGIIFKADDFCNFTSMTTMCIATPFVDFKEVITDSKYQFTATTGSVTSTLGFIKLSNTRIQMADYPKTIYLKQ